MKLHDLAKVCYPLLSMEFDISGTMRQLSYGFERKVKVMSWGSHAFKNLDGKGLLFKVKGHKHKGYVLISLDWTVTHTIDFIATNGEVKKRITNVYFDELTERIDEYVEKIKDYAF